MSCHSFLTGIVLWNYARKGQVEKKKRRKVGRNGGMDEERVERFVRRRKEGLNHNITHVRRFSTKITPRNLKWELIVNFCINPVLVR